MEKIKFLVSMNKPDVPTNELKDYIEDAVVWWGGQLNPDHPLFNLRKNNVQVEHMVTLKLRKEK